MHLIVKNENSEATKKTQSVVGGLKDFGSRTGMLMAGNLISLNESNSQMRVVNFSDNETKLLKNTKAGSYSPTLTAYR